MWINQEDEQLVERIRTERNVLSSKEIELWHILHVTAVGGGGMGLMHTRNNYIIKLNL